MNHAIDYVERRESEPRVSSQQLDDALEALRLAEHELAYGHHLNAVRTAIQMTPLALVDRAFLGAILDSLGCRAIAAQMPEIGEKIEVLACEVTP